MHYALARPTFLAFKLSQTFSNGAEYRLKFDRTLIASFRKKGGIHSHTAKPLILRKRRELWTFNTYAEIGHSISSIRLLSGMH